MSPFKLRLHGSGSAVCSLAKAALFLAGWTVSLTVGLYVSALSGFICQALGICFEAARLVAIQKLLHGMKMDPLVSLVRLPFPLPNSSSLRIPLPVLTKSKCQYPSTVLLCPGLRRTQRHARTFLRGIRTFLPGLGEVGTFRPPDQRQLRLPAQHRRRLPDRLCQQFGPHAIWWVYFTG